MKFKELQLQNIDRPITEPRYPIYIITKGRFDSRFTIRTLTAMKVRFYIVIEPHEYHLYKTILPPAQILVLPFSNLGQGSIPARNFVWDHSTAAGDSRHWIWDDNIKYMYRSNANKRHYVGDGTTIRLSEDFVDRYENVKMSGQNYSYFCVSNNDRMPPFYINTRIYSCILLSNDLTMRWRGLYNEDTDLSLRILKDGWCTILFNAFLCGKITTMTMTGGNTEELYKGETGEENSPTPFKSDDNRRAFAESLRDQHPDIVTIVERYGRWHHQVDYRQFAENKLILKAGLEIPQEVNEHGMKLVKNYMKIGIDGN